jgi:hypothetical protein
MLEGCSRGYGSTVPVGKWRNLEREMFASSGRYFRILFVASFHFTRTKDECTLVMKRQMALRIFFKPRPNSTIQ